MERFITFGTSGFTFRHMDNLLSFKNKKQRIKISVFLLLYMIGLFGDSYYGLIKNISFIEPLYHFIFYIFDYTRNGIFFALSFF